MQVCEQTGRTEHLNTGTQPVCHAESGQGLGFAWLPGYSGKVAAEIGKLRAMAQRGQDRAQLGMLMGLVTERATVAVAQQPERTPRVRTLPHACMPLAL